MNKSSLHDETTFYNSFLNDLQNCREEVFIESPFITTARMRTLYPTIENVIQRGAKVYIMTRDPIEHEEPYRSQSESEISRFEQIGVQVLICRGNHHRKLAIIDRKILWEGSLNILSQIKSREIMRRIDSKALSKDMFNFLKLAQLL